MVMALTWKELKMWMNFNRVKTISKLKAPCPKEDTFPEVLLNNTFAYYETGGSEFKSEYLNWVKFI